MVKSYEKYVVVVEIDVDTETVDLMKGDQTTYEGYSLALLDSTGELANLIKSDAEITIYHQGEAYTLEQWEDYQRARRESGYDF